MAEKIKEDDPDALCTKTGWARWTEALKTFRRAAAAGPDVANARFYIATVKAKTEPEAPPLFLECERANDARRVAVVHFGGVEVDLLLLPEGSIRKKPEPRVQVRWLGSAARRTPDLRIQTRRISKTGSPGRWADL